jgi:hypothetical protein
MVETITPVVDGRRARWGVAVALHVLGATVAASGFGMALGAVGVVLGAPFGTAGMIAVAGVAAVYGFAELMRWRLPVPQLKRQVPSWWRTYFPMPVAALLYGSGLGVGFLTFLAHGTFAVVSLLAIVMGRPMLGALIVGPFGLARGLSVLTARRARTIQEGRRLVTALGSAPVGRRALANGAALVVLSVASTAVHAGAADWPGLAGAVLALCFAWSGGSKLVGWRRWKAVLSAHRLPPWMELAAVRVVPAAELCVPALALLGWMGAAGTVATLLLLGFSVELARLWRTGSSIPCGCFGGRRSVDVRLALIRNAGLGGAAIAAATSPNTPWLPRAPEPADILPMVLAWGGVVAGVWLVWRARTWLGRTARA